MAKKIADSELRRLALPGAQAKLRDLQAEVAALLETFPELRRGARGRRGAQEARDDGAPTTRRRRKPGRKTPMTAAERKAVSDRMKKYWAEKRGKK